MPRANRYHVSGLIWHITHRCHKREFLLKFARDRRRWVRWLFEARKRYGLTVLNYMVTSNHIHLLAGDGDDESSVARSMQLVAGRMGQEYNLRKGRGGAFWEDRYHATAVESGEHLRRCMAYIDLNMCRAGAVAHPSEWECCGYQAIQDPPMRYRIIDYARVVDLLGCADLDELAASQRAWVSAGLGRGTGRDEAWSESVAVGSEAFVRSVQTRLGVQGRYRGIEQDGERSILRDAGSPYIPVSGHESGPVSTDNTHPWRTTL